MSDVIRQNSYVLFFYNRSKKWLDRITRGREIHTHIGVLHHTDAIGRKYGSRITTNKSKYVYLLKPTLYDYTMKLQHGTQIVYPKELGYIVARAGIGSGQKILEIGSGSGSLTSFVANVVRPRGHVYSFDVDESFMKIAQKNIDRAGVTKFVTLHSMDIKKLNAESDVMPVSDADVVLIDLGDPWEVLPQVRKMLKGSGCLFAICPTVNQLEKFTEALVKNEFTDIESTEQILRNIEARTGKTRHSFQGIGHTTYLCFARKAYFGRNDETHTAKSDEPAESLAASKPAETRPRVRKTVKDGTKSDAVQSAGSDSVVAMGALDEKNIRGGDDDDDIPKQPIKKKTAKKKDTTAKKSTPAAKKKTARKKQD